MTHIMSFSFTWPATLVSCWGVKNPKNQNYYDAIKNHKSHTLFNSNQDPFFIEALFAAGFPVFGDNRAILVTDFHDKNITLIAFLSPPNCWELIAKNVSMIIGLSRHSLISSTYLIWRFQAFFFSRIYIFSLVWTILNDGQRRSCDPEFNSKYGI